MQWTREQVLEWVNVLEAGRKTQTHYQRMTLSPSATAEQIAGRFRDAASMAHPDLHRAQLNPEERERLEGAYGLFAASYVVLKDDAVRKRYDATLAPTSSPSIDAPSARSGMNAKAQNYFRKAQAELSLGKISSGQLNLRLAVAADPLSAILRAALAEVDAELGKSK